MTLLNELIYALKAYETLDNQHANCKECDGEVEPEACGECSPFADDARLRMRAALDRARGTKRYGNWRPPDGGDVAPVQLPASKSGKSLYWEPA